MAERVESVFRGKIAFLAGTPGGGHWRKDLTVEPVNNALNRAGVGCKSERTIRMGSFPAYDVMAEPCVQSAVPGYTTSNTVLNPKSICSC
jgi:hypothetical protein